mgnify:CR=1 FL=1
MELIYEFDPSQRIVNARFEGLDGTESVTSVKDALCLLKVRNPAVKFAETVQSGGYNDTSDAEYEHIFQLANEGKSSRAIAAILTEEQVLIPAAHAKEKHPEQYHGQKFSDKYLWSLSAVQKILNRQEYLGHTVLHRSVVTNFKLHKRRETDEAEQYVFPNTHEAIISQELWDSVHRRIKRVERASPWGSQYNRLSGYLYCADCGRRMTLQTHHSKKDGSIRHSFRCGGYASQINTCTAHSISANNVEALLLSAVKRLSRFVLQDEEAFAAELQSLWADKQEAKPQQSKQELKRLQTRYDELSRLVRGLYENLKDKAQPSLVLPLYLRGIITKSRRRPKPGTA